MAGKLAGFVHVHGPNGSRVFGPDDEVPADVAKLVTNPKAWAVVPEPEQGPTGEAPPRSGPGSGVEAWKAYAAAVGVNVAEGASRDDVIAAVDTASASR